MRLNHLDACAQAHLRESMTVHIVDFMNKPVGVVERSAVILRAVATAGASGARLLDIAHETGISRPTVHRILNELADVGFVSQTEDKHYRLGSELFLLGLRAPRPQWDLPEIRQVLEALAEQTGDTVYLAMREFDGVRYLMRLEGNYPVRALVVEVGESKPFDETYSGLALQTGELVSGSGILLPGIAGMAAPVPSQGEPVLAVSISATSDRLPEQRYAELAPALLRAASDIAAIVAKNEGI